MQYDQKNNNFQWSFLNTNSHTKWYNEINTITNNKYLTSPMKGKKLQQIIKDLQSSDISK